MAVNSFIQFKGVGQGEASNTPSDKTASTATVQLGENDLGQVASRLGVDKNDLLAANPQIKDPSKLTAGQDINLPDKGKTGSKGDDDDGSKTGKTTDKDQDQGPKFYGDPLAASAMKGQLDSTKGVSANTKDAGLKDMAGSSEKGAVDDSQGGNTKTKDVSKHKDTDSTLPPDEQAIKNAGGDKALKGYQQFKQAGAELNRQIYVAANKPKIEKEMKELDDLGKKLEANPSDLKTQMQFQQKYDQLQKDLKPYMDAVSKDPQVQTNRAVKDLETLEHDQAQKAIDKAS
jgi:hypothetical protein